MLLESSSARLNLGCNVGAAAAAAGEGAASSRALSEEHGSFSSGVEMVGCLDNVQAAFQRSSPAAEPLRRDSANDLNAAQRQKLKGLLGANAFILALASMTLIMAGEPLMALPEKGYTQRLRP